jgi:hypothetical protein
MQIMSLLSIFNTDLFTSLSSYTSHEYLRICT